MGSLGEFNWPIPNRRIQRKVTEIANGSMVLQIFALLVGVIAWELYARTEPDYIFPTWSAMYDAAMEVTFEYGLPMLLLNSIVTILAGFSLAVIFGVMIAYAMGLNDRIGRLLNPYVNAFYVAPISAFVPLILYIGGATFASRVFVVFIFAVFEIIIDTYEGISTTPKGVIEAARSFGASDRFVVRHVVFPHNLPYMFTGFRLGAGRAVRGVILAELIVEFSNVGGLTRTMQNLFRIDGMLVIAFVIMAVGIVFTQFIKITQYRMIPWSEEVDL